MRFKLKVDADSNFDLLRGVEVSVTDTYGVTIEGPCYDANDRAIGIMHLGLVPTTIRWSEIDEIRAELGGGQS